MIAWLRVSGGPYSVARPSLAAALARLAGGEAEVANHVGRVRAERADLANLVASLGGSTVPSQANFVLARFGPRAGWVRDALAALGIGVRVFPDDPTLGDALRITCPGDVAAFGRLGSALRAALAPEAVLLDMDGVLADVSGSYREAIRATAATFGVAVSPGDVSRAKAGGGANNDWALTRRLVVSGGVEASLEEVTSRFEALYQGTPASPGLRARERLIPVRGLLGRLAERARLGVVTGRPRRDAERFLAEAGLEGLFGAVVCLEDGPEKPDPAGVRTCLARLGATRAWLVGDSVDDVRAARAAGVVPVGVVAPGEGRDAAGRALGEAGAARVLGTLDELEEVLS